MICPACNNTLTEKEINGIILDVCQNGCGGIWFDWHELKKFDEPHEYAGDLVSSIKIDSNLKVDHSKRRKCPRCEEDITMLRHFSSVKKEIEVDECGNCAGFWLDFGELSNMRDQFQTETDRSNAAKKYIFGLFDEKIEQAREETKEKLKKTKNIVSAFRFICPSNYIEGEQSWGAF